MKVFFIAVLAGGLPIHLVFARFANLPYVIRNHSPFQSFIMRRILRKLRSMTTRNGIVQTTEVVFPEHANHYGTLFGGHALNLMAKAAFLSARGVARCDVVMARCSEVLFHAPVPLGSTLRFDAHVARIGRSSLTVRVTGRTECVATGALTLSLEGAFELVAIDAHGRPAAMAPAAPAVASSTCSTSSAFPPQELA
jgi:acyl-CoA hydrolase